MTIKDLQPSVVWNNFYGLTRCPRPSKHEEIVRQHLLDWAKEHKVEAFADETGNVIMRIPATPGFENRKGVVLQGHMDMVPQKTADTKHDFLKDPIETVIDGEWVTAKGTTLGADNGMGVAMAMSVAEDKSVKHGPVEILVTYDEETGMTGAEALKPGLLKGDILLNLDSEDELELCIGCAGGLDAQADFKYKSLRTPRGYKGYKIELKGLAGGHSGMDISLYRANANKVMVNTLIPLIERYGAKVADFSGGSLRNAIPFEAEAIVALPAGKEAAALRHANKVLRIAKFHYAQSDPGMQFTITKVNKPVRYIEDAVMLNACKAIAACPSNVIRMSQSMPGLTETSINLAVVRCRRGHLTVNSLLRSALNTAKQELALRVKYIFEFAGAKIKFFGGYPGWTPKPDTPVNKLINDMHVKLYGKPMNVMATHGGLECALLGAKYPNWEMVSIGPTVLYPHSPDERVHIPAVQRSWDLLKAVLENIPEK
jgi:dipeptidase D